MKQSRGPTVRLEAIGIENERGRVGQDFRTEISAARGSRDKGQKGLWLAQEDLPINHFVGFRKLGSGSRDSMQLSRCPPASDINSAPAIARVPRPEHLPGLFFPDLNACALCCGGACACLERAGRLQHSRNLNRRPLTAASCGNATLVQARCNGPQ